MSENEQRRPRRTGRPGKRARSETSNAPQDGGAPDRVRSRPPRKGRRPARGTPGRGGRNTQHSNEMRLPDLPKVEPADPALFTPLGIAPTLLSAIGAMGYATPTPIQTRAIPLALEGHDVMGLAQTGTGKTAAFGLPLVQTLLEDGGGHPAPRTARSLVLAPTRELAGQIAANLRGYATGLPIRVTVVVGGLSIAGQAKSLERGTDILVATPGRLLDLVDRRAVTLGEVRQLVLDEADQMLDLGFIHDLKRISALLGEPRRTMLFSATMPAAIEALSRRFMTDPVRVETAPPGKPADKIEQGVVFFDDDRPALLLEHLQADHRDSADSRALVFARTKHGAEKLMKRLRAEGLEAASIHGNKSQNQRDRAVAGFRSGATRVLVATDVAARGIDIPGVSHVYNYELPDVPEAYVHRIGRTARAGREGKAIAFCTADEFGLLLAIERVLGRKVDTLGGTRPERAPRTVKGRGRGQRQGNRGAAPGAARPEGQRRRSGGGADGPAGAKRAPGGQGRPGGRKRFGKTRASGTRRRSD